MKDKSKTKKQLIEELEALRQQLSGMSLGGLRQDDAFLMALLDAIPNPIYYKDQEGVYRYCNRAFSKTVLGLPKAEIVDCAAADIADVLPPELLAYHQERDGELLHDPGEQYYEALVKLQDGASHYVLFSKATLWDTDRNPNGIVGVMLDITDFKLEEERHRMLIENVRDVIWNLDMDLRPVYVSPSVTPLLGYTVAEALALPIRELLTPDSLDQIKQVMAEELALESEKHGLGHPQIFTLELQHKDGSSCLVEMTAAFLRDGDNIPTGILCVARDVTRREIAETKLSTRARRLFTALEIAKVASSILSLEDLLSSAATLICDGFNFYYVGLFLVDEAREWALLRSGTGDAGQVMLAQGHKLKIGDSSMIGWSVSHGEARIALDVGEDSVRFSNPWLPETRSEMALPLNGRGEVIGAMTIQAREVSAFSEEDIASLQTMADQLAHAIQNVRLLEATDAAMRRSEVLYRAGRTFTTIENLADMLQVVVDSVAESLIVDHVVLYILDTERLLITHQVEHGDQTISLAATSFEALLKGLTGWVYNEKKTAYSPKWMVPDARQRSDAQAHRIASKSGSIIVVPLLYQGEILGILRMTNRMVHADFSPADVELAEALANQATVAVYNARLFERLQRRAKRLETTTDVSNFIGSILDLDSLLPQSVEVIRERFDLYYAGIFLVDDLSKWAVLRAGTGEAGLEMLENHHRLEVGGDSMIGSCVTDAQAHIALDVGKEARRFNNPALPKTRSEMALPLRSFGKVIGAMTIQSAFVAAFSAADVAILQTMADQLATAIENARLFEQVGDALSETEVLYLVARTIGQAKSIEEVLEAVLITVDFMTLSGLSIEVISEWSDDELPLTVTIYEMAVVDGENQTTVTADLPVVDVEALLRSPESFLSFADARDSESVMPEAMRQDMLSRGWRGALRTGLTARGRLLGFMNFSSPDPLSSISARGFKVVARTVADQVAVALDNLFLVDQTQIRAAELELALTETEMLYDMTIAVSEAKSPEDIVLAVAGLAKFINMDSISVRLFTNWDVDGMPLTQDSYFAVPNPSGEGYDLQYRQDMPFHRGMLDWFGTDRRQIFTFSDLADSSADGVPESIRNYLLGQNYHGMIMSLLYARGRMLGVFGLYGWQVQDALPQRYIDVFVRTLIDQVAVAFDTSSLLAEIERRALRLETASEVSRSASSILDVAPLLSETVNLIRERFNLYYAGIFLLDDSGRWAVLRAGSGEAGSRMVDRGHRLEVGGESMIGACVSTAEAIIRLDVGQEAGRFDNPDLPDTRSEMALPLISRGGVIGAMTIQSDAVAAFSRADITILHTMADQLSNAIANARLFAESEERLEELLRLQQRYAVELWQDYSESQDSMGYAYDLNDVSPLSPTDFITPPASWDGVSSFQSRGTVGAGDGAMLMTPLEVRGEPVGVLSFEEPEEVRDWSDNDVALLDAVRDQISLALENRLLLDQSQRALGETRERESEVRFLQEIAVFLNTTDDIVASQGELMGKLKEFFPIDLLGLVNYDARNDTVEVLDSSGVSISRDGVKPTVLDANSASAWVVKHGEPVVVGDMRENPRFSEDESFISRGMLSRAVLPMKLGYRVLGTMNLGSKQPDVFNDSVMLILQQVVAQVASAVERASLLRQTQNALGESQTLYAAISALAEASTYETVLRAIVDHTIVSEKATAEIDLFVVDPESGSQHDWMETVSSWGNDSGFQISEVGLRRPVAELPGVQLLGDEPLFICEDIFADVRLEKPKCAIFNEDKVRAFIVAPLVASGQRIGVLQIRFSDVYHPTEQDERLYRTASEQAAVVLSNRQLLQLSQGRAEQLSAAVDLANLTTSILDRDTLFKDSMDFFQERFGLYYAGVFLLDELEQWAELRYGTGSAGQKLLQMGYRVQVGGDSIIGKCAAGAKTRVILDVLNEPTYFENPLLADTQSLAVMPLVSRGRVIGVLSIQSDRRFAFTQEDTATLQLMANQLANVIESSNLYESSQSSLAETTMLYRIAQRVTDARTLDDVLHAAVEGISERSEPDLIIAGLLLPLEAPTELRVMVAWDRLGTEFPVEAFSLSQVRRLHSTLSSEYRFISPDATQDPLVDDFARDVYQRMGVRAMAAFQLEVRGVQYGSIMIHSRKAREFSTAELRFYESVARQAFVALESLNLVQSTQEEAERRAISNEVLQTASSALDPLVLMKDVGEVIALRMDMPVMMSRWDDQFVHPVSLHDAGGKLLEYEGDVPKFLPGQVPFLQEAIDTRQSVYVDLLASGTSVFPQLPMAFAQPLEEAVAVPLTVRDKVFGVLVLGRQAGREAIEQQEKEFIDTAAINISVALETARLYQDAQDTAEKLKEVDRLKTQFMANMSHELRTPLNSIIGFSRVIIKGIDGPLTEMQKTDLTAIHESGQHLLSLINDILDVSKIEAGKMELILEETDLKALVKSVMSTSLAFVKGKPIKLLTDVPDDLPNVLADNRRVRQVLINLIGNAGKFTENGFIKVGATYDDYQVVMSVQDTGIGIPDDRVQAVFEQFEQVDSSSTRRYGGTGLGVPLSKRFIELHTGDMWLETEYGTGTTFFFSLPIEGPKEKVEDEDEELMEPRPSGQNVRTILAVDDDKSVITLFRRYLEKQGYRVFGLTNSDRVVEEARRLSPYAITLDVVMPNKDGWKVIQELKSDPETRNIPIIVCSVLSDADKGLSMGIADYLMKPIAEQDLIDALSHLEHAKETGHVLVVDDNPDDRKLLYRILEDAGYNVETADGGAEAISMILANPPTLVVLDLMMPDVDGFAVLESLKGNRVTRHIPVVVVTAKELEAEERARLQQGVEALLEKGIFDQDQLLNDVTMALNRLGGNESGSADSDVES